MSGVTIVQVSEDEGGLRLDRWFKRHYPNLSHIQLQRLLRKGHVRLEGKRAKASARLEAGQSIRVPPMGDAKREGKPQKDRKPSRASDAAIAALHGSILHIDDDIIALDKPPGLAVQGGTGIKNSVDAMLGTLKFDKVERPKLVHRLDKDTSGVLLLGRSSKAAAQLTAAFRAKSARKVYWAIVVGSAEFSSGRIDLALSKLPGQKGERMVPDPENGKRAVTFYRTIERVSRKVAWLSLEPQTGRTHQLRVHMEALGTPILGDRKYGGVGSLIQGPGLSRKMHLHARAIRIPHPSSGQLEVIAPLPTHMSATWDFFGLDEGLAADTFYNPEDDGFSILSN
jgi:23S rRNA pseudouridine955/2504/2580 synthase